MCLSIVKKGKQILISLLYTMMKSEHSQIYFLTYAKPDRSTINITTPQRR